MGGTMSPLRFALVTAFLCAVASVTVSEPANNAQASVEQALQRAESFEKAGRMQEAAEVYRSIIAAAGPEPSALSGLGSVLSELGDLQGAVSSFKKALKAGAKPRYGLHYNIGYAYMQAGKLGQAAKHFEKAVKHNPQFREGHIKAGSVYRDRGDVDLAAHHLQAAIALEPQNPNAYSYLGGLLNNAKRWTDAVSAYRTALSLDPSSAGAENRVALADTLSNLKRYTEAAAEYDTVVQQAEAEQAAAVSANNPPSSPCSVLTCSWWVPLRSWQARAAQAVDDLSWREQSGHGCDFFAPGQPGAAHCHNPAASSAAGVPAADACPRACAAAAAANGGGSAGKQLAEALAGALHSQASRCEWASYRVCSGKPPNNRFCHTLNQRCMMS